MAAAPERLGDVDLARAEQTAAAISDTGAQAVAAHFVISDDTSVKDLVSFTVATHGGLDAVHVNAGAMHLVSKDTDVVDIDLDVWDGTVAVNLRGHMLVTRHCVPELLARGGGAIVYTSSIASFTGEPRRPAYAVTKAGINALARHVASRWGKDGIRANTITPGLIMTSAIREKAAPEMLEAMLARTRSTRHGEAGDVAAMVAFLLSSEGSWINGQGVNVDGGTVLRLTSPMWRILSLLD